MIILLERLGQVIHVSDKGGAARVAGPGQGDRLVAD